MSDQEIRYTVRVSARAKRVVLRVRPQPDGELLLEVTAPVWLDLSELTSLVRSKAEWVRRTMARLAADRHAPPELPGEVYFQAVGQRFVVQAHPGAKVTGKDLRLTQNGGSTLVFSGDVGDVRGCWALLRAWLLEQGKRRLPPWLRELSQELGLPCDSVRVRAQRTRWGSCTAHGGISLNCRLLFLPPELARYVLVHELCHTVHLNHGPRFWALVARHEPGYKALDKALGQAWRSVPAWSG
jgi:predicted metal-dependent hydrolase